MPRRARPSSSLDSPAAKRLARIDAAFDAAAAAAPFAQPPALSDETKGKRRAVVPDDEDEDAEMELVETGLAANGQGGGFLLESEAGMQLDPADGSGGSGFIPNDQAGGFLPDPDPDQLGGGFLPDPPGAGGFLPPSNADANAGGFLPDPPATADTFAPFPGGGFFSSLPGDADLSLSGGFFPDPSSASASFELPTPAPLAHPLSPDATLAVQPLPLPDPNAPLPPVSAPPERIPLSAIPAALSQLGLASSGLAAAELLALFEEVASSDDDEPSGGGRGKSVRRERFREACEVLLEGEEAAGSDEPDEGADEYRADGADDDDDAPVVRRQRPARTTRATAAAAAQRRSKRAKVAIEDDEEGEGEGAAEEEGEGEEGGFVREEDFGAQLDALPSDSDDSDAYESEDSDGLPRSAVPSSGKPKRPTHRGKASARRGADIRLTADDLASAADSFDLFFVDSAQAGLPREKKVLGLPELQRAARVLKEKMNEGELNEMLGYAARSKGAVDLEAFARILVETGL
ncbi:hypothetical protein JCM10207_008537 [Rhodosporidiobolus poonsookiae]